MVESDSRLLDRFSQISRYRATGLSRPTHPAGPNALRATYAFSWASSCALGLSSRTARNILWALLCVDIFMVGLLGSKAWLSCEPHSLSLFRPRGRGAPKHRCPNLTRMGEVFVMLGQKWTEMTLILPPILRRMLI